MKDLKFIYTHFVQQCKVCVEYAVAHDSHSAYGETEALGQSYLLEVIIAEGDLNL